MEDESKLTESELTRLVRNEDGVFVCHDADYATELAYLKEKVDAGADLIITQMFFEVEVFDKFVNDCRAVGIAVPILPGIMYAAAAAAAAVAQADRRAGSSRTTAASSA